jgi:hypothetical protein
MRTFIIVSICMLFLAFSISKGNNSNGPVIVVNDSPEEAENLISDLTDRIQNDLNATVETKDASGADNNDGFIKIKITGGQGPYSIYCFSPYSLPYETIGQELKLENIKPGNYLFVIQDKFKKSLVKEIMISYEKK